MADKKHTERKTPERKANEGVIRQLADLLEEIGLSEIEYGEGDWRVRVAKKAPAPAIQTPAAQAGMTAPDDGKAGETDSIANHPGVVVSPMVGVVYTADEPGAPPYVKVGDMVKEGDTMLLIEAMKVFNQIKAPRSGKVIRVLISSGMPVEFGEPLLIIE
ncbi:MAG TPA: acetyl-CoA carboxylase biotin carboxyl carrier protein [Rhodospirillales bacterium]|nr:acetyl-CoA carboxylase biotin carboxyl carrier protein [Rhodospirillales bacterium]